MVGDMKEAEKLATAADAFEIVRVFDAPRDMVWRAWTEGERLAKWWGPKAFEWIKGSIDLKPGGVFHYGMKNSQGGVMWGRFVFWDIQAPGRLVFVNSFSDEHGGMSQNPWM